MNMKKILILALLGIIFSACNSKASKKTASTQTADTTVINLPTGSTVKDENTNGKSLNDIRFKDFKKKVDWIDNDYIRAIRTFLDDYQLGHVKYPDLDPYKDKLKGQFIVYYAEPFIAGGLYVSIVFLDNPTNVFTAWVYSDVDEEKEKVLNYYVKSMRIYEEPIELTKEEIMKGLKEMPGLKLW